MTCSGSVFPIRAPATGKAREPIEVCSAVLFVSLLVCLFTIFLLPYIMVNKDYLGKYMLI